jgi:hypothetical protein
LHNFCPERNVFLQSSLPKPAASLVHNVFLAQRP